ncbi:MAG: hypothetical protein JW871_02660 [Endomicrobiales bacterium]|nr:hypothetical protein [Endomicrobiales bacterium]
MKTLKICFYTLLFTLFNSSLIFGSEIVLPASQIEKGKGSISFYYARTEHKINLEVKDIQEIDVNGVNYFSEVSNEFECSGAGDSVRIKFIFNPNEGLYYWVNLGAGFYELEIPSTTVKNNLSTRDNGWLAGIGARKTLFPDTIVSPAIAVEIGLDYSIYDLNSIRLGNSATQLISNRLNLTQIHLAALVSKKYKKFEPYGGLKVFRTYATLKEKTDVGKVTGIKDNIGLFLGTKLRIYEKEAVIIEGSFIGETNIAVGWNLEF